MFTISIRSIWFLTLPSEKWLEGQWKHSALATEVPSDAAAMAKDIPSDPPALCASYGGPAASFPISCVSKQGRRREWSRWLADVECAIHPLTTNAYYLDMPPLRTISIRIPFLDQTKNSTKQRSISSLLCSQTECNGDRHSLYSQP